MPTPAGMQVQRPPPCIAGRPSQLCIVVLILRHGIWLHRLASRWHGRRWYRHGRAVARQSRDLDEHVHGCGRLGEGATWKRVRETTCWQPWQQAWLLHMHVDWKAGRKGARPWHRRQPVAANQYCATRRLQPCTQQKRTRKRQANDEHDQAGEAEVGLPTAVHSRRPLFALLRPLTSAGRSRRGFGSVEVTVYHTSTGAFHSGGHACSTRPPIHLCAVHPHAPGLQPPTCTLVSSAASVLSSSWPRSFSRPSMACVLLFSCAASPASSSVRSS